MRLTQVMFRYFLICILLASQAQLALAETSPSLADSAPQKSTLTIKFAERPDVHMQVTRANERIGIQICNLTGQCHSVGRENGYTVNELQARATRLEVNRWIRNLVYFPAGVACSAVLGGGVGAVAFAPKLLGATMSFAGGATGIAMSPIAGLF